MYYIIYRYLLINIPLNCRQLKEEINKPYNFADILPTNLHLSHFKIKLCVVKSFTFNNSKNDQT